MIYNKNTVIAELAGKDSIVAIIKYAKENKDSYILPTIIKVPSEESRHQELFSFYEQLQNYITTLGSHMYTPLFLDESTYWWSLNQPIASMIKEYNFYSPCIACHGLLHSIRIPLAQVYSGKILTGEKLLHNGKIKINQNSIVLDIFDDLFKKYNIEVIRPIDDDANEIIDEFYNQYNIEEVKYIKCYMSGNSNVNHINDLKEYNINKYCYEYLIPKLDNIIKEIKEEGNIYDK